MRRQRHRSECHMKKETKIGAMWPHAKEYLEPHRCDDFSSRAFRGITALSTDLTLDFWPPELQENQLLSFEVNCENLLCQFWELIKSPHYCFYCL